MDLDEYKVLSRIRVLMDENPTKAKQTLTIILNVFEEENLKAFVEED